MERGKHYEKNKKRREKKKEKLLTQERLVEDISKSLSDIKKELGNKSIDIRNEMKIENLCSKITKEQMAQQDKELPLEEDEIGSQLKEVLEKAKVGFTFQQYMKLQEFRKDGNYFIHVEKGKSIYETREELKIPYFLSS
ncbi:hypothetical protein RIR_jg21342.t1 [Rhizophagus irregularis DAOM 181602=DAOM 197198]|nr:hypothetical protein RIR_jg21342.t1 [Rhizophagus irregularis DAOM 181602=DAOM 197198]